MQKVIADENLLDNCKVQGAYLGQLFALFRDALSLTCVIDVEKLLIERLQSPNALAAPFTFDIRGGGLFWAVEFDFDGPHAAHLDFKGSQFSMVVQARALDKGLIAMGMVGTANLQGTEGCHVILAPAYNVTKEQIDNIVDILVDTVEEVLRESVV